MLTTSGDGQPAPATEPVLNQAPSAQELATQLEHLRRALESRPVIDMAKGILIARTGCSAEEAFQLLVIQSQHENRKVREVAAELIAWNVRPA